MVPITRLYADDDGHARFEDIEIPIFPEDPPPDMLGVSEPWQAVAVLLARPAGGSHPEQPEHRRQLVIGISGRVEVTATGETRIFGPGDILLVEDTEGFGHSSRTSDGFRGRLRRPEPLTTGRRTISATSCSFVCSFGGYSPRNCRQSRLVRAAATHRP